MDDFEEEEKNGSKGKKECSFCFFTFYQREETQKIIDFLWLDQEGGGVKTPEPLSKKKLFFH